MLARDLRDLQDIISTLNDKCVSISFLKDKLTFAGDADDAFAKLLSCWCYPERCHCDYLAELANESE